MSAGLSAQHYRARTLRGKRLFDVTLSVAALAGLTPVLAAIAATVKFTSPGPVLYRGQRVGRGGRAFTIYKFRTMTHGSERPGPLTTAANDPRITRVGRFLRRYKLDELPQLLNVVRGDMSLVGPRPEFEQWLHLYTPRELAILSVRPGITDYSSIEFIDLGRIVGESNPDEQYLEKVFHRKNALRLRYVEELSWRRDLQILATTMWRIVFPT